jgi:hypothetical protein
MQSRLARLLAGVGAGLGWAALALQFMLTLALIHSQGGTTLLGVWRFLGYFTVIANLFAAIVLSLAVLGHNTARLEFCGVTAMTLVGVVYSLLLRETWNPQGWQKLADLALHDVMPILMLLFWLLRPHGGVRTRDAAAALVLPLSYCAYAVARGALDGWYPYPFMDVGMLGAAQVTLNCLAIGAGFAAMALVLLFLDHRLG